MNGYERFGCFILTAMVVAWQLGGDQGEIIHKIKKALNQTTQIEPEFTVTLAFGPEETFFRGVIEEWFRVVDNRLDPDLVTDVDASYPQLQITSKSDTIREWVEKYLQLAGSWVRLFDELWMLMNKDWIPIRVERNLAGYSRYTFVVVQQPNHVFVVLKEEDKWIRADNNETYDMHQEADQRIFLSTERRKRRRSRDEESTKDHLFTYNMNEDLVRYITSMSDEEVRSAIIWLQSPEPSQDGASS